MKVRLGINGWDQSSEKSATDHVKEEKTVVFNYEESFWLDNTDTVHFYPVGSSPIWDR